MDILMITPEAMPFARTGGLADSVTALSSVLVDKGHNVKILMPRYYGISKEILTKLETSLNFTIEFEEVSADIYTTSIKTTNNNILEFYFLDYEKYFGRDGIYGSIDEPNYSDNPQRFSLLCHSAFHLCTKLNWFPKIIHSHDWPTALVPVLLKFYERKKEQFAKTKSVFTAHNLGYQGIYSKYLFPTTGIDWLNYYSAGFEDYDNMNLLKAGIQCADLITTVSPTYAKEIQLPESGFRLDSLLRYRSESLYGILDGINYSIWNPQTDKFIKENYSIDTIDKKVNNKYELQKKMGLEEDPNIPLIGISCQFLEQNGISELFAPSYGCIQAICKDMRVQCVVMGTGEQWCEQEIKELEKKLPNFKAFIGYDEQLEHLIISGSDFLLMPSKYEPCGRNQMCGQIYGTLPITRNISGYSDSIENYDEKTGKGTGFLFNDLTPQSVYDTTGWAIFAWYNKPNHIAKMKKRAMTKNFSWENSATEYEKIYSKLCKNI